MNDTIALLARALLSALFIVAGAMKLMNVAGTTAYLARVGVPAPQIAIWGTIALELIGGLMILLGFKTRWAAVALAVFSGVTIYFGHQFWAVPADQYLNQLNHALKNLGLVGGFLLLLVHGPGRHSVDGR